MTQADPPVSELRPLSRRGRAFALVWVLAVVAGYLAVRLFGVFLVR